MKFGTVRIGNAAKPVMWLDDGNLLDLAWLVGSGKIAGGGIDPKHLTLEKFIALGHGAAEEALSLQNGRQLPAEAVVAASGAAVLAPIPRPNKNVFCVGRNYLEHIAEDNKSRDLATDLPRYPQYFTKPPATVIGPDAEIRLDETVTRRLDYEVELGVVFGTRGRDFGEEKALDHVFGYTIVNDVTGRDAQARHDQWFKGKALDTTCPMGPWIVHKSAIADPQNLDIRLWVNGELRQDSNTSKMIFPVAVLIDWLTRGLTVDPGDIIATGTPSGAGYAMDPRRFLADGDVVKCEIQGIGTLTNTVRKVRG